MYNAHQYSLFMYMIKISQCFNCLRHVFVFLYHHLNSMSIQFVWSCFLFRMKCWELWELFGCLISHHCILNLLQALKICSEHLPGIYLAWNVITHKMIISPAGSKHWATCNCVILSCIRKCWLLCSYFK